MSKSLTARLISAAGLGALVAASSSHVEPPAPGLAPEPTPGASTEGSVEGLSAEAQAEVTALLQTTAAAAETKGFDAATERAVTVFESDAGMANPVMACFMLTESKLGADAIIDKLAKVGPAATTAAVTPPAPAAVQPTLEGMAGDPPAPAPAPTRAPGAAASEDDTELQNSEVFPGVDFSGKSAIVEDQGRFSGRAN